MFDRFCSAEFGDRRVVQFLKGGARNNNAGSADGAVAGRCENQRTELVGVYIAPELRALPFVELINRAARAFYRKDAVAFFCCGRVVSQDDVIFFNRRSFDFYPVRQRTNFRSVDGSKDSFGRLFG